METFTTKETNLVSRDRRPGSIMDELELQLVGGRGGISSRPMSLYVTVICHKKGKLVGRDREDDLICEVLSSTS